MINPMKFYVEHHHYHHNSDHSEVLEALDSLSEKVNEMAVALESVVAALEAETVVIDSVVVLLGELTKMISEAGVDPVALAAVIAKIESNKQTLADAVVAHTPAGPPVE